MANLNKRSIKKEAKEVVQLLLQPQQTHDSSDEDSNMSKEIANQVVFALQPMFLRLTNEIMSLRNDVKGLKKELLQQQQQIDTKDTMLPASPFTNIQDFIEFELKLQDSPAYATFEKELSTVARAPNFVKNCWKKLFNDDLAQQLCWKGTETKKSVRGLTTAYAIRSAAISLGQREEEFIKSTKAFFQFAKNRQKLREEYKNKKYLDVDPL